MTTTTTTKLVPQAHGGALSLGVGRKKGSRSLIKKTFYEFARATLEDPEVQKAIRQRLMDELAGKRRNPLPALAVLAAVSVREKPIAIGPRAVVFVAEILNGRGRVTRVEIGGDEPPAPTEELIEAGRGGRAREPAIDAAALPGCGTGRAEA